jgi:hypothetical protein
MSTVEQLRLECRLSKNELAREARIDFNTLQRAINGDPISLNTANKLAYAISTALGRSIQWQHIEGLNVKT